MPLLFEFLEFSVILKSSFLKTSCFHSKSRLKLMYFSSIKFFHSHKLGFESLILYDDILILMKQVIYLELQFRDSNFFSAKLIFEFDKFVLEFDSHFSFIVQIVLILLFGLFKLFSLIFKHELNLTEILILIIEIFYKVKIYFCLNIHNFLILSCIQVYFLDLYSYFQN